MLFSRGYGDRCFILEALSLYQERILNGVFRNISYSLEDQCQTLAELRNFIKSEPSCFLRECLLGHVTGSAFVVNSDFSKVLFTYHAKLKKWLQLGGHCDGDFIVHNVAMREANEESGILNLEFIDFLNFPKIFTSEDLLQQTPVPFDIDIHIIPARINEPTHKHFDIRYLLIAKEDENIIISEESLDLKWIPINNVIQYTKEPSTLRQVEKFKALLLQ